MLVKDVCYVVTWHVIIFPSYKQYCLFTWRRSSYKSHKQGRWFGPPQATGKPLPGSVIPSSDADMRDMTIECLACRHSQITSDRGSLTNIMELLSLSLSLSPINYLFFPPCLRRLEQFLRQKEEKLKNGCRNWGFLCDGKPTQRTYTRNLVQIRNIEKHGGTQK